MAVAAANRCFQVPAIVNTAIPFQTGGAIVDACILNERMAKLSPGKSGLTLSAARICEARKWPSFSLCFLDPPCIPPANAIYPIERIKPDRGSFAETSGKVQVDFGARQTAGIPAAANTPPCLVRGNGIAWWSTGKSFALGANQLSEWPWLLAGWYAQCSRRWKWLPLKSCSAQLDFPEIGAWQALFCDNRP